MMNIHSKTDKHINDVLVVANSQSIADNIMNDFLLIIKDDPDFSCISRTRHSIYFKGDLGRIIFIGQKSRDRIIQGFRGHTMNEKSFRMIMDKFKSIKENMHEL